MRKYEAAEVIGAFGYFSHYYTTVTHHSRFPKITYAETQILSDKTKAMGEFMAAVGIPEIDFSILKDVLTFVDDYLDTGEFKEDVWKILLQDLEKIREPFSEIIDGYKQAGIADEEGNGAHIVLFVPIYAENLLICCDMLDKVYEEKHKREVLDFVKTLKRNDPDGDPQKEQVPEPV
jgi:hypothetical protein